MEPSREKPSKGDLEMVAISLTHDSAKEMANRLQPRTCPREFALLELFSGGLSDRLLLELTDGRRELFVVNDLGARFEEIRAILGVPIAQRSLPKARVIKRGRRSV